MVTRGSQLHRGSRLHRAGFCSEQVGYRERPTKMPLIGSKAAAYLGWSVEFPVLLVKESSAGFGRKQLGAVSHLSKG